MLGDYGLVHEIAHGLAFGVTIDNPSATMGGSPCSLNQEELAALADDLSFSRAGRDHAAKACVMTRRAPTPIGEDHEWLAKALRRATDNAYHLYDSEITFVDQLREKCDRFGEGTFVSAKQRAWLERIMARLDRLGVAEDEDDADDAVARPVDEVMR